MSSLSIIGLLMGSAFAFLGAMGLFKPLALFRVLDIFPRHRNAAIILTLVNVIWVTIIVHDVPFGRFEELKFMLYVLAPVTFFAVINYMEELLAPRMLGGTLLLMAAPIFNLIRWHESDWRIVVTVTVYILVVWGMLLMLSPYRFRHFTEWLSRSGAGRPFFSVLLVLGMTLIGLALVVY